MTLFNNDLVVSAATVLDDGMTVDVDTWFPPELRCLDCAQPISRWVESTWGPRHVDCPPREGDK